MPSSLHQTFIDLRVVDQILLRARAVDDVDLAVAVTVVAAVVDDRVQRGKTDAARDEQQVLALQSAVSTGKPLP